MFQALKKTSLIKLRILSLFDTLNESWHFLLFSIILGFLTSKYYFFGILLFAYLIYLFIKARNLCFISLFLLGLFFGHFLFKDYIYKKDIEKIVKITFIEDVEDYVKVEAKGKRCRYIFYLKDDNRPQNLKIGNYFEITNKKEVTYDVHYPGQFDYGSYLHYQNVKRIDDVELKFVRKGFSLSLINYVVNQFLNTHYQSPYMNTLLIGNNDNLETSDFSALGISHLFVISGLHMGLIIGFMRFLFKKLKIKEQISSLLVILVALFYLVVTNFMVSLLRVVLSLIIKVLFKKIGGLDRLCISAIILLICNPYYINQMSFILTYVASFFIICYKPLFKLKNKILNYLLNLYLLTLLIQLFSLPFTIKVMPSINVLAFLIGPVYVLVVSYIFLPLSFLYLLMPFIKPIYLLFCIYFNLITSHLANIKILMINLGDINVYFKALFMLAYYLFLAGLNVKKYYLAIFPFIILIMWYFKGMVHPASVYFFDLPKGEATLFVEQGMKEVILIDSGDVNDNVFVKVLIDLGIRHIDYFIISHSDTDHIGGISQVIEQIRVDHLIISEFEDEMRIKEIKAKIKKNQIIRFGDELKTKNFHLVCVSPKMDYGNLNDNSLVLNITFHNYKFLMTGDISKNVEQDLCELKITTNFLKVAHHGSITSSSTSFLEGLKYQYAIIMSGFQNTFGFPNDEVVAKLKNPFICKLKGTLIIKFKPNGKLKFSYAP